ncbi:MAG: phosphoglycolate phosphatase [Arenicellales bacterium]
MSLLVGSALHSPQGFLFDLDGTLVDSAPDLIGACNRVLRSLDREPVSLVLARQWIGNGAKRLVERALAGTFDGEADPHQLEKAYRMFQAFYLQDVCVESRLYPGVRETLERLHGAKKRLACVTNKPSQFTRPLLAALELDHFFDPVVSGDDLTQKKPDPLPLEYVASSWQVRPDQCLMVGDSISDFSAAKACHMPVVLVRYGYHQGLDIEAWGADAVLDSFDDLANLLAPSGSDR